MPAFASIGVFSAAVLILATSPLVLRHFPGYLPSHLIQVVALVAGYAYARRFDLLRTYPDWTHRALLLCSFVIPLQNTFFPKVLRKVAFDSHLLLELFRPEIMLLIAVAAALLWRHRRPVYSPIIGLSFLIGLVGWILATGFSAYPSLSAANGFFEFLVPFAVIYAFTANTPDRQFIRHSISLLVIGSILVAASQSAEIVRHLSWLPITAADFINVKQNLTESAGANGLGNTDNFASLWVLLVPFLSAVFYTPGCRGLKVAAILFLLYAGLLVYSRSSIFIVLVGMVVVFAFRLVAYRRISTFVVALVTLIVLVQDQSALSFFGQGVQGFISQIIRPARSVAIYEPRKAAATEAGIGTPASLVSREETGDISGIQRAQAWRRGFEIAVTNLPFGVGFGVYPVIEPTLTAPHSLILLRLAEGGFLSLVSLLLFALYPLSRATEMMWTGKGDMLEFSCVIGVSCMLLKGFIFGSSFSIGGLVVWGYAAALFISFSLLQLRGSLALRTEGTEGAAIGR